MRKDGGRERRRMEERERGTCYAFFALPFVLLLLPFWKDGRSRGREGGR